MALSQAIAEHTGATARTPTGAVGTSPPGAVATDPLDPDLTGPLVEPHEVVDRQTWDQHWAAPQASKATTRMGADIVKAAETWLGTPYVWGGTERGGVDCSGLVQSIFGMYGVNLPRVSFQQMAAGSQVGYKGAQAGDLWGIDNSERNHGVDHIAIYAGDGWIIEAPRTGLNVRKRKLSSAEIANGQFVRVIGGK